MSVECALCKKALGISKHHRHFSSVEVRLSAKGRYYCESCKGEHWPTDIGPGHKLHVTSSMLHRYWANNSARGDSRHVDHVSVCGGSIPELNRACEWELERLRDRPVDVVLFGGTLNSVAIGFPVAAIRKSTGVFSRYGATVPFAPKFCIFPPTFENRDGSNKIGLLTGEGGKLAPRGQKHGCEGHPSTAKGKLNAVDPDAWRE